MVLTLVPELARRVAFDGALAGEVFGLFAAELGRWQEEAARAAGVDDPQAGSVMEVQRAPPTRGRGAAVFAILAPLANSADVWRISDGTA